MLDLKKYRVVLELDEDLLGTVPRNKEIYGSYIAGKAREHAARAESAISRGRTPAALQDEEGNPVFDNGDQAATASVAEHTAEEAETIEEIENKGHTGFHEDADGPFLFDYAIKGYLSEAARTLKERGKGDDNVKQLQDKFKRFVFVKPRRVRLPRPARVEDFAGKPLLIVTDKGIVCERPLRAMTAQGPRVTVVRSDVILAGAKIEFELHVLEGGKITKSILQDVLDYGQYLGLGQWRSGGFGRFSVVTLEKI